MHVSDIVLNHWTKFGRNYYCRYDYEGVSSDSAQQVMNHLTHAIETGVLSRGAKLGSFEVCERNQCVECNCVVESG